MRKEYHKLVRDRIPETIQWDGRSCEVRVLVEEAYLEALRKKVVEEAREVAAASEAELVKEIGDVYEVLDVLTTAFGRSFEAIRVVQADRRSDRGGF